MSTQTTELRDLARAYESAPGPATLQPLRDLVRHTPGFRGDLELRAPAAALLRDDDHTGVVRLVAAAMPGAFFSPAAHRLLARSLTALGESDGAAAEERLAVLSLRSVLGTGDGTSQHPWSVLRLSDEADVLESRGRRSVEQRLIEHEGRWLDRHLLDDDSVVWFDVTALTPVRSAR